MRAASSGGRDGVGQTKNIGGSKMTTVQGSKGRRYEVREQLYGTSNLVQRLYFGGVFLSSTSESAENGANSSSMMETIKRANERADEMGIEVAA